jgi:hypothetical protein
MSPEAGFMHEDEPMDPEQTAEQKQAEAELRAEHEFPAVVAEPTEQTAPVNPYEGQTLEPAVNAWEDLGGGHSSTAQELRDAATRRGLDATRKQLEEHNPDYPPAK